MDNYEQTQDVSLNRVGASAAFRAPSISVNSPEFETAKELAAELRRRKPVMIWDNIVKHLRDKYQLNIPAGLLCQEVLKKYPELRVYKKNKNSTTKVVAVKRTYTKVSKKLIEIANEKRREGKTLTTIIFEMATEYGCLKGDNFWSQVTKDYESNTKSIETNAVVEKIASTSSTAGLTADERLRLAQAVLASNDTNKLELAKRILNQ